MRFLHKNHHHLASHCVHYVYSLKPWSFAAAFLPRSIKGVAKLQQVLKPLSWEKSLQALVQMHCQHFLAFKTPWKFERRKFSYLAPLGDFGLFDNLDGHGQLIFGSFAGVDGPKAASAQQRAHFVGQFEGGTLQRPVHDRFQVGSKIRSEMAANAHPDISAKEVVPLWNDLKWRLYF